MACRQWILASPWKRWIVSTEGKGKGNFSLSLGCKPCLDLLGSGNISFEGLGKDHTIDSIGKDRGRNRDGSSICTTKWRDRDGRVLDVSILSKMNRSLREHESVANSKRLSEKSVCCVNKTSLKKQQEKEAQWIGGDTVDSIKSEEACIRNWVFRDNGVWYNVRIACLNHRRSGQSN